MYLPEIESGVGGGGGEGGGDTLGVGEYVRQLTAEELVTETIRAGNRAGFTKRVWKLRPGRQDNHHFDTAVACYALCDALNGRSITRARFEQTRAAIKPAPSPPLPPAFPTPATPPRAATPFAPGTGAHHEQEDHVRGNHQDRDHQGRGPARPRLIFGPLGRLAGGGGGAGNHASDDAADDAADE